MIYCRHSCKDTLMLHFNRPTDLVIRKEVLCLHVQIFALEDSRNW